MPSGVRRRIVREAIAFGIATAAGIVLIAIEAGTALSVAGISLLGLGLVGATVALFMEVGLSEDRERRGEGAAGSPPDAPRSDESPPEAPSR
jgi:hypothetical protein